MQPYERRTRIKRVKGQNNYEKKTIRRTWTK